MESTISERIIYLRKQKGLTQRQLSEKLHISDKAVSKWELGKGVPSVEMLELLADLFECSIDYLIRGKKDILSNTNESKKNKEEIIKEITYTEQVFSKMLEFVKPAVSDIAFEVWFQSMTPIGIEQDSSTGEFVFMIQVPTRSSKSLIVKKYSGIIIETLNKIDNAITSVNFVVDNPFIDPYFKMATRIAIETQMISVAYLQRRLQIGYSRAAEIIDTMEERKFISPMNGRKLRDVYIDKKKYEEVFNESFDS